MIHMRRIHVDYNRQDADGRLIVGLNTYENPLPVGTPVETWQAGEDDMVFEGVIDEITESGRYKIKVNWENNKA